LTPAQAGAMSIDQLAEEVKRAYSESYAAEQREQPFSDVMIGKLIIE
jgi:flagellar FliL protein